MHSHTCEAIVLKVYDVGEADRFCILFTRERGRLAARARGVRKLTSRMGGALLPFSHVRAVLKESGDFLLITAAQRIVSGFSFLVFRSENYVRNEQRITNNEQRVLQAFTHASQGTELLLKLLHDEHPLPEIFNATLEFLKACQAEPCQTEPFDETQGKPRRSPVPGFTFHLLHLLGHLPENADSYFKNCSEEDRQFIAQARIGNYASSSMQSSPALSAIASALINDQIASPLRATAFASNLVSPSIHH